MSTKPDTGTGWSKEFPSLRYGSWFWLRDGPDAEPRLVQLCGGYNFYEPMGIVGPTTEYLGPISPSDFEQLRRLRKAVEAARTWICRVSNQYYLGADDPHEVLVQLRQAVDPEALAHKGGQS